MAPELKPSVCKTQTGGTHLNHSSAVDKLTVLAGHLDNIQLTQGLVFFPLSTSMPSKYDTNSFFFFGQKKFSADFKLSI